MPITIQTDHTSAVLYTRIEAAQILHVSPRTMQSYIRKELIPSQLIGNRTMISERNLLAFIHGARSCKWQRNGRRRKPKIDPPDYAPFEYPEWDYDETDVDF